MGYFELNKRQTVLYSGTRRDWWVRGFRYEYEIDYQETLSPVVNFASICATLAIENLKLVT